MAGLISNLDLVITVDTALAHLAGGLGVDTIMLSRFDACWRWYPYTQQTQLYRSMSCLYQPEPFDWQSVIDELRVGLRGDVKKAGAYAPSPVKLSLWRLSSDHNSQISSS